MFNNKKPLIIWLFGLISGFTIMISGYTLNYWLAKEEIDIRTIGILASISLPYAINFLWAPIFDTKSLGYLSKVLGHRLSWICCLQFALVLSILLISQISPKNNLILFSSAGLLISFFSSAQDTVLGALKTEILSEKEQATTSGMYIFGYRIGMLISSSCAVYMSSIISLSAIYLIFAMIIFLFSVILVCTMSKFSKLENAQLKRNINVKIKSYSLSNILVFIKHILKPVGQWSYITVVLIFLVLYRLPDNFINTMINPFLIHLGYDAVEIASVGKSFGVLAAIIGGLFASAIMKRYSVRNSLLIFGILHAIAHSFFIIQAVVGKSILLLCLVIGVESVTGGMAMAAYIAFISSLCKGQYRATQYSFFSSMMGLSRSIFPTISGYLVLNFGWGNFFFIITLLTIPSLLLSYKLTKSFGVSPT